MKHLILGVVGLLAVAVVVSDAVAREARRPRRKPAKVTVTGTVSVTKEKDKVKSVTLTVDEETSYKVRLCQVGQKLAAEAEGKQVEAVGVVQKNKRGSTLKVNSFKLVQEEGEKEGEKEGEEEANPAE
jgi:hypothetical protein